MMRKIFNDIKWYLKLARWPNLLIIILSQYLVRYDLIQPVYDTRNCTLQTGHFIFALLVLSTVLIVAAGYIINDYFDIRIDVVNRPHKMILHKHIPLRQAIRVYYTLTILGCLMGIYVSYWVGSFKLGFVPVIMGIVLWYYSSKYKRMPFAGNFAVAILTAISIGMIWLFEFYALQTDPLMFAGMIGYFGEINMYVLGYAIFAFLITLIREMIKDIEDIEGDRSFRCRTLPIVYGIPVVRRIIFIITAFILGFTAYAAYRLFEADKDITAWYFAVVIGLMLMYFLYLLRQAKEKKEYHFISNILKIIILAGVLSMQLLYVSF